jgi:hypothetical protein
LHQKSLFEHRRIERYRKLLGAEGSRLARSNLFHGPAQIRNAGKMIAAQRNATDGG